MNSSHKDAPIGAPFAATGGHSEIDSAGVAINIESDDNDSTTAEHDCLLPPATPAQSSAATSAQLQTTPGHSNSTSIHIEQEREAGNETPLSRLSGSARRGSSNILNTLLLAHQRAQIPAARSVRIIGPISNRRLQLNRSVSAATGSSSLEDPPPQPPQAPATAPVRQLGFWRVNLNEVFSLSTAPSAAALRSFISYSNIGYPPQAENAQDAAQANEPVDNAQNNGTHTADNAGATTSAALRFNTRTSGIPTIARSISLREGELRQPHHAISSRRNASVNGLSTALATSSPPMYDENAPIINNAAVAGDAAGQAPHEHNGPDEHVLSDMVVQILSHFVRYLPIIFILLIKFIHDHLLGILDLLVMQTVMLHANKSLRTQVARLAQKNYTVLMRDTCFLTAVVILRLCLSTTLPDPLGLIIPPPKQSFSMDVVDIPYHTETSSMPDPGIKHSILTSQLAGNASDVPYDSEVFKAAFTHKTFDASESIPLGVMLYYIAVSDIVVKLLTMIIKYIITMLPVHVIRLKVRARLYVLIEYVSQFYRALAPITLWFGFLYDSYSGLEVISGCLFAALYLGAKVFELLERGKSLKGSIVTFRRNIDQERQPTKEELEAAGAVCPICHDAYNKPVILECGHIFCDECVSTWFKREQTCPMCRAKVSDDPTWQDGATSFFWQIF